VKALYAECNRFVLPPLENMELLALALNGSTKWPMKFQIFQWRENFDISSGKGLEFSPHL